VLAVSYVMLFAEKRDCVVYLCIKELCCYLFYVFILVSGML